MVFRSEPGKSYPGEVARLGRETDRETREFLVDVRVKELPRELDDGPARRGVHRNRAQVRTSLVMPAAVRPVARRQTRRVRQRPRQGALARGDARLARIARTVEVDARACPRASKSCGPWKARSNAADRRPTRQPRNEPRRQDIRHNFGRFALTTVGIGLLLMIVMGMGGIYRGLIREATLLVDKIGADLWVVQGSTRGPFAEISRVPANLEDRVRAVPGVAERAAVRFAHDSARASRPAVAHGGAGTVVAGGPGRLDSAGGRTPAASGALRDDCRPLARLAARREAEAGQGRLRSRRPDAAAWWGRAATACVSSR